MSDDKSLSGDPDERAFTGHSDHPPEQPDQPAEENQELLDQEERRKQGDQSGGDAPGTTLPGYG